MISLLSYFKIAFIASILFACCHGDDVQVNKGYGSIAKKQNNLNEVDVNEIYKNIDDRSRILLDTEDVTNGLKNATDKAKDIAGDVEETLSTPPSTWSQYQWILIAVIVVVSLCIIGCLIKCCCCK